MDTPLRKNTRLRGFDYRSNHAYFVTICTQNHECVFGTIDEETVRPSRRGLIAAECWQSIRNHHPHVELDAFVVMPNHVHGIVRFIGATYMSPSSSTLASQSLGVIIGTYKAAVSRAINRIRPLAAADLWQRNYYDHVIRHDRVYAAIWQYIDDNPRRWHEDEENPAVDRAGDMVRWLDGLAAEKEGDIYVAPTK